RALDMATALPPLRRIALERRRHAVRMVAARSCSAEEEEAVVGTIATFVEETKDPETVARFRGWQGRLRYRQGRFEDARGLHSEASRGERWITDRTAAMLNAGSALLEAFRHETAMVAASEARELAAVCRHPILEARAEWLMRAITYRDSRHPLRAPHADREL